MEVKKGDDGRLEGLPSRLDRAKSLHGIDQRSSSMQNADLLEKLPNCFEFVTPSAGNAKLGTSASSTMRLTLSVSPFSAPPQQSSPESLEQKRPRKRQIYVDAAVDDPCFACTGESIYLHLFFWLKGGGGGGLCFSLIRLTGRRIANLSRQNNYCFIIEASPPFFLFWFPFVVKKRIVISISNRPLQAYLSLF